MLSRADFAQPGTVVLLASPDPVLLLDLKRILNLLGLLVETATNGESTVAALASLTSPGIVLLDVRLAEVANGRLLAAIDGSGVHKRCAVALIAEQVTDEWIARLREGVIDDIVPRDSDAMAWGTHVSTMQRGHQLHRELEDLREAALMEVQHDQVTGTFTRETMLSILFRETDRVQRLQGTLCLVIFDIDDFGHWNSELSRDACDGILLQVAKRTGRILRSYDMLGRLQKDAFLLAMPGCSVINAVMLAERLRMEVFGEPFTAATGAGEMLRIRLTACFGITSSGGRSPVVVLREAERTLAYAKLSGPDSIRCANESPLAAESAGNLERLFPGAEMFV